MTEHTPEPYRKTALILAAVAVIGLSSAIVLAFVLPPQAFDYQTPAAMAVNTLGIIGLLAILGIGIIGLAAGIKRVEKSETVSRAVMAAGQKAAQISRPKVTTTSGMSTADELAKWVALRDRGVVTQDEFESAKSELLKTKH